MAEFIVLLRQEIKDRLSYYERLANLNGPPQLKNASSLAGGPTEMP